MKRKRKSKRKGKNSKLFFGIIFCLALGFYYVNNWILNPISSSELKKVILENQPKGFVGFGIDVSHHQGEIDWVTLMNDFGFDTVIHFVYVKATEGKDYLDPLFRKNQQELNKLGVKNGVYHFYQPKSDPIAQMDWFLLNYMYHPTDLPPVLDVEIYQRKDVNFISNLKLALIYLEEKTGVRPIIYTSYNLFSNVLKHDFMDYQFWVAAYSKTPEMIEDSRIIHWQYTDQGRLPGVKTHIDFNVSKMKFLH